MPTKTVAVQLVALTQQYQKSMAGATASTAKLQAASGAAGKSIGAVMGPQIAVAGVVVAGVAAKMAYDFDNAFTKIGAITDTSQAQLEEWKVGVKDLAGETARSPQELADALYFLASAGLDTADVMPTLELSAKAAAVGLGETADIARLTANAMNAYAKSGLDAAQVTDILVAAVREGTAEPDEFADAMGRILPIASKAGISFDQVAASLAAVSNIGLDVNEGVTAMRGVMTALLAPGAQAAETLDSIGLSANDVRRSLAEDGLIATLRLLEAATGGNIDMLRKIIPNVRAMTGAFGLTGQEAAKVDEVFHDVMRSSGSLSSALDKTKESSGHKLRQALVDLQVVAIDLGERVLPLVVDALELVVAIADPVVDAINAMIDGFEMWGDALTRPDTPTAVRDIDAWTFAVRNGTIALDAARGGLDNMKREGGLTTAEIARMEAAISSAEVVLQRAGLGAEGFSGNLGNLGTQSGVTGGAVEDFGGKTKDTGDELERAEKLADRFAEELERLAGVALSAEDAALGWNQALADMQEELKGGTKTLDITTQAGRDNREAFLSAAEAAIDHGEAVASQTGSVQRGVEVVRAHIEQLRDQAIAAGFTKDEINDYIRVLNLTPKQISTLIEAKVDKAKADVQRFIGELDKIPDIKDVLIRVRSTGYGTGQQTGHAGGVVGNLPRYHSGGEMKSDEQLVLARKGETIRTVAQERALMNAKSATVHIPAQPSGRAIRVGVRFDRRRFTTEYDHDATYSGRWS
jgi:TP901 family phage tail tape measure protein